ncbi:hypothetical protein [Pasteuria penetrans]|uniref:hypothetical protein n=1 Tax=Pasteuria penetrans TaxID=86005 RepID=UPI000FBBBE0D|nr:hypothetical protein [Pasteuria penetrans]
MSVPIPDGTSQRGMEGTPQGGGLGLLERIQAQAGGIFWEDCSAENGSVWFCKRGRLGF